MYSILREGPAEYQDEETKKRRNEETKKRRKKACERLGVPQGVTRCKYYLK